MRFRLEAINISADGNKGAPSFLRFLLRIGQMVAQFALIRGFVQGMMLGRTRP
jgi:hypothetical protein